MSSSGAPDLPVTCSSTPESDRLTGRPESSSIMIHPSQASSHGQENSNLPSSGVVPDQPAPMDMLPPATADRHFMALNEPFMGACQECSMMCMREHGTSVREHGRSLRPPCFYKMVSDYCVEGGPSCWMQVPSAFVRKYLPHVDRKRMVLENADGKTWPVVYLVEHGFFTGWAEFSTANNLTIGDTLFFSFVDDTKFVVHVYGKSGCEKRVPTKTPQTNPPRREHTPIANPASSPAHGFTRSSRPDAESGGRSKGRGDWDGFRAPTSLSHGGSRGTYEPVDDNTTPQTDHLPTPDWIGRQFMDSKGRPSTSEIYKFQSQSAPGPRNNVPNPSWHGEAGPSTCPNLKLGQQGDPRGEKKASLWSQKQTWSQKQARALVAKARFRKLNITPLPMSKHRGFFKSNRSSPKKRSFVESLESDGEIGFDAGSNYDGGRRHSKRERRSFSKDGAFVSSLDSLRWDDEEAAADLRAFQEHGMNSRRPISPPRFQGGPSRGPSRHRDMRNSFDDIPSCVPQYVPEYVQLPRKPGRPRKYPPPAMPQQTRRAGASESSDGGQVMPEVKEKRKRGRPFKHQIPGSTDMNAKPLREIFVSRRRKVTQAEREVALNSAYKYASHLKASTTFVVVMRQSFVYRNFVLGVPRRFANRYMPDTNREVTLVDETWNGWFCSWNAGYKYISGRGWRNFALEHCIEEDDALLMEIVEETDMALTIKAYIFRVVAIPDGLTGFQSHVCPPNSYLEPNSGVPIQPVLRAPGKIQPRLYVRPRECNRNQASGKRVKREPVYTEDSFTTSFSSESEELY